MVSNAGQIYATAAVTFANALTLNGSTLHVGGGNNRTVTWNGPVTVTGTSGISADGGTSGITLNSTLDITGATFSSFANGTINNIVGGISGATGSLVLTSGTLQLSGTNTYTGTTTLSGTGILRLQATGTIADSSSITINGSGNFNVRNTVDWVYNGTIDGDGTGSINLNTGTNATLAGNISGVAFINANSPGTDATISGAISGSTNVTVQGGVNADGLGAILRLGGANSYSGNTTVARGTLVLAASDALPDTTAVSIGNATLDAATFKDRAGTLAVTNTASIALGSGGALAFADSSAVDWSGGTLNLTGAFVSGTSLRFGTDSDGLTPEQLALITATGYENFTLDSEGFLTATAAGTDFDTWAAQISDPEQRGREDDADGDGFTNLQEFLLGTSPVAGNGSLVSTTASGGDLTLRWLQREHGASYTLSQSESLAAGSWTAVVAPLPALDGDQSGAPANYAAYSVTLPTSGGKWFFRIEGQEN